MASNFSKKKIKKPHILTYDFSVGFAQFDMEKEKVIKKQNINSKVKHIRTTDFFQLTLTQAGKAQKAIGTVSESKKYLYFLKFNELDKRMVKFNENGLPGTAFCIKFIMISTVYYNYYRQLSPQKEKHTCQGSNHGSSRWADTL